MTDQEEIPSYPFKLSRDERRAEKERTKVFKRELKRLVKGTGWRSARGTIFRQKGDWFVSNLPTLAFQRGVITRWTCKPMAIDPLFWKIVGLEENDKMPLSFRDQGAWTLRPLSKQSFLSKDVTSPADLAADVLKFSNNELDKANDFSLERMLADLEPVSEATGSGRSIAVCLLVLLDRYDQALEICGQQDGSVSVFERDSGGFTFGDKTFFDAARDWISTEMNIKVN